MRKKISKHAIGVFDSGVGGLTVVKELIKQLPNEKIIYFGDTARVPYGPKSVKSIKHFAMQDTAFLISQHVKLIVVACNTVSSNAMPLLQSSFSVPFIDVLKPNAELAAHTTENNRIGIIGTYATVETSTYETYIRSINKNTRIFKIPTPLLVPLAEEGLSGTTISQEILKMYLSSLIKKNIDTLILGCTHYPLFEKQIKTIAGKDIQIINSARHTALCVKEELHRTDMLNKTTRQGKIEFYLSDIPRNFNKIARRFLNRPVKNVKHIDIERY